jgi:hypothetical protein
MLSYSILKYITLNALTLSYNIFKQYSLSCNIKNAKNKISNYTYKYIT